MNIVFFGSDDFAEIHLKRLIDSDHHVVGCVAPPDRPKGRGMQMSVSPVKQLAEDNDIAVLQPISLKEDGLQEKLIAFGADLFVVIAYGRFLPQTILDIPEYGAINVHGSLLPKYRGAAPINWSILNGETQTGVTVFKLETGMDSGDIICQSEVDISMSDTAKSVREKLKSIGPDALLKALNLIESGNTVFQSQNKEEVTFAPKLNRQMGLVKWDMSAKHIHNLVRGLFPWPGAYFNYQGKRIKILRSACVDVSTSHPFGTIVDIQACGADIQVKDGLIRLIELQPESSKAVSAESFMNGIRMKVNDCLPEG